jgi:N-hydroxyarylamine O-acetyltransferase
VDLEMANHYTSTHPDSKFVQTLTAQLASPEGRWILRNLELTVRIEGRTRTEAVDPAELPALLRGRFGLEVPEDARFHAFGSAGGRLRC